MPVSHFHAPFQGKEGREKANKQVLFPEFIFSKGTRWGGSGHWEIRGVCWEGVLWPAIENCCPYPERSVYTTCKVKQIDPGCRFTCAAACNPPSLSSSITEHCCWSVSLFLFLFLSLFSSPIKPLSVRNGVCVCMCVCLCLHSPHGWQAWIQESTWGNL